MATAVVSSILPLLIFIKDNEMKIFSDYALEKLIDLYKSRLHEAQ